MTPAHVCAQRSSSPLAPDKTLTPSLRDDDNATRLASPPSRQQITPMEQLPMLPRTSFIGKPLIEATTKFIPHVVTQPSLLFDGLSLRPPQSCHLPTKSSPLLRAMMTFPIVWHKPPWQHMTTIKPLPMPPGAPSMDQPVIVATAKPAIAPHPRRGLTALSISSRHC
jgi:hypothetical protein